MYEQVYLTLLPKVVDCHEMVFQRMMIPTLILIVIISLSSQRQNIATTITIIPIIVVVTIVVIVTISEARHRFTASC